MTVVGMFSQQTGGAAFGASHTPDSGSRVVRQQRGSVSALLLLPLPPVTSIKLGAFLSQTLSLIPPLREKRKEKHLKKQLKLWKRNLADSK